MRLIEILPEIKDSLNKFKVHLATGTKENDPLHAFFRGDFQKWQEWQSKKNFEREFIITFIYMSPSEWLFAGIFKSNSCNYEVDHYQYQTELLDIKKELVGRLVIKFEKSFRASYLKLENHIDNFIINEILKERRSVIHFNGFENVLVDFNNLKTIIKREEISWKTALQNIKGVYLITDRTNGKLYVGSAYGEYSFWSRWSNYTFNGHGNNVDLIKLIQEKGYDYAQNFQFSILEIRSSITDDKEIICRENHWKRILLTREFGYNSN